MHEELAAWKPRLTVGKTYCIRNFRVHDNNNGYRMTPHKFRLTVVSATRLNEVDEERFDPNYVVGQYNATPYCMLFEINSFKINQV
jgi:hypothetical protein